MDSISKTLLIIPAILAIGGLFVASAWDSLLAPQLEVQRASVITHVMGQAPVYEYPALTPTMIKLDGNPADDESP